MIWWCFYIQVSYLYHMFSYFVLFSTSWCSRLDRFIVYLIHSLRMWFTHSFTFPSFQVRYCRCFYRSCSSWHMVEIVALVPRYKWLFYFSSPLGRLDLMFLLILILYNLLRFYYDVIWYIVSGFVKFIWFWHDLVVYDGFMMIMIVDMIFGYPERDLCCLSV